MDKRAKKILFNTYWSKNGWKENTEQYPSSEDFIYAKEKGLMFDPFSISHDDCVKKIVQLGKTDGSGCKGIFVKFIHSTFRLAKCDCVLFNCSKNYHT